MAPVDTASRFLLIQCYCYWVPAIKHWSVTFAKSPVRHFNKGLPPMKNKQHTVSDNYIVELTLYTMNGEVNWKGTITNCRSNNNHLNIPQCKAIPEGSLVS